MATTASIATRPAPASMGVRAWVDANRDVAFELVRMYLGVGLVLKAVHCIANPDILGAQLAQAGTLWFEPAILAHYVIFAHLVGGIFLALGLFTRAAALVQVPVLVGALLYVHLPRLTAVGPREPLEFAGLVLFLLLVFAVFGSGRWSVDSYLAKSAAENA